MMESMMEILRDIKKTLIEIAERNGYIKWKK